MVNYVSSKDRADQVAEKCKKDFGVKVAVVQAVGDLPGNNMQFSAADTIVLGHRCSGRLCSLGQRDRETTWGSRCYHKQRRVDEILDLWRYQRPEP